MQLEKLIDRLLSLQEQGYGDYDVCYTYSEEGVAVRDTIKFVEKADPADGNEIHMWQ